MPSQLALTVERERDTTSDSADDDAGKKWP